ncbi:unnamed protein product, partial [Ixodes pacificus]
VASVALKLPPFWPADPALWFAQVEAQFSTRRITAQMTKFHHVITALSPTETTEVRDLILTPPDDNPFDKLKLELIRRNSASEQKRLQQLLTAEDLGDRKPSQMLRRMTQLLGEKASNVDDSILHQLFLQRLPANVCMVLAAAGDIPLHDLAALADKVLEVASPTVSNIQAPHQAQQTTVSATSASPSSAQFCTLQSEIRNLTTAIAALQTKRGRSPERRSGYRSRSRSRSSSTNICWYHRRFGDNATKCTTPCHYTGNGTAEH